MNFAISEAHLMKKKKIRYIYRVFHKRCAKYLRGDSRYPNNLNQRMHGSEIKCKGACTFGNLAHKDVKALFLLWVIRRKTTVIACKYDMGKRIRGKIFASIST